MMIAGVWQNFNRENVSRNIEMQFQLLTIQQKREFYSKLGCLTTKKLVPIDEDFEKILPRSKSKFYVKMNFQKLQKEQWFESLN